MPAAQLASALQGLPRLQALALSRPAPLDLPCMLAIAGLQQLTQLWLQGAGAVPLARPEDGCLLLRCPRLRKVLLSGCHTVPRQLLMALVCKPGMEQLVVDVVVDEEGSPGAPNTCLCLGHGCPVCWQQQEEQAGMAACLGEVSEVGRRLGVEVEQESLRGQLVCWSDDEEEEGGQGQGEGQGEGQGLEGQGQG